MNDCPCLESIKTLFSTGKWDGGCCTTGKRLPLSHLILAGIVGLLLSVLLGSLFVRRRRD